MITADQLKDVMDRADALHRYLNIDQKKVEFEEEQLRTQAPDFWEDPKYAQEQMKKVKGIQKWLDGYKTVRLYADELKLAFDFYKDEMVTEEEVDADYAKAIKAIEDLELKNMLRQKEDPMDCVLKINSGAGGTESQDWAQMLMRMYTRWAERKGYATEVIDYLEGEEAGVKSVTIEISGPDAYGHLKSEHGVHRLVRISPFNAAGKRQTSFVSCDVMPDIDENIDIEINPDDLRIDTYRSSGAGGQHINKTSSAIRITHLPTGIVVQCQNERSQHQNKDKAMQMLKAKLYLLKQQENAEKTSDIRGDVKDINFGNQIRSYVLQPYTMVKDHRTNKDVGNAQSVLDGNIDPFINAYLIWLSTGKKAE